MMRHQGGGIEWLSLLRVAVLLASLGGLAATARAQPESAAPGDQVRGHPGKTYADLIRLMTTGFRRDGVVYRASRLLPMRHIGRDRETPALRDLVFDRIDVLPLPAGPRPRLALLIDLGRAAESAEGFAVLALVDPTGSGRLLDAANVAYDRQTGFFVPARLEARVDVVITASRHANSNQAYQTTALIAVRRDRLSLIDTIFTLNDRGCGYERNQTLAIAKVGRGARAAISASVAEETQTDTSACDGQAAPAAGHRLVTVHYRWDSARQRYVARSDALERLARETEERF
jgi:hypothetical protein